MIVKLVVWDYPGQGIEHLYDALACIPKGTVYHRIHNAGKKLKMSDGFPLI